MSEPLSDAYLALMTADAAADLYVGRGKTDVPALLREVERLRGVVRRGYEGDPDDLYAEGERLTK